MIDYTHYLEEYRQEQKNWTHTKYIQKFINLAQSRNTPLHGLAQTTDYPVPVRAARHRTVSDDVQAIHQGTDGRRRKGIKEKSAPACEVKRIVSRLQASKVNKSKGYALRPLLL